MKKGFTNHYFHLVFITFSCLFCTNEALAFLIPKAPSNLTAVATSTNTITISWIDNATDETAFELETSLDGLKYTKIADLKLNTVSYFHDSLTSATKYWYRVAAKNSAGKSAFSNVASTTTLQTPPAAPIDLSGVAMSQTQINLTWIDASNNETGFQVERSLNGSLFTKIADVGANVSTYQNTGLTTNTLYYYRVRAVNAASASAYSNAGSVRTLNIPAPDQPINFTAVPTAPGLIQLRWSAVTGNAAETIIERTKASDENFLEIGRVPAAVLQFEDTDKFENTDYFYRIKAVNAGGSSPYSLLSLVRAASIITSLENPGNGYQLYLAGKTLVATTKNGNSGELMIYNLSGKKIKSTKLTASEWLDLSGWVPGIYIAVIRTDREVISSKIALY